MNEGRTTAIFAVVAAVSLALALWSRPGAITDMAEEAEGVTGKSLFEKKFEDPSQANSFEIVKYDEDLARLEPFSIVKDPDTALWRLPSYNDYPADASDQVRDATTPLIGLEVLNVISTDRGDHSLYGVVNPDDEDLSVEESGVGMLLRVKGDNDEVLASLIVGKEVAKAEGQRYVRIPSQDAVYQVELSTEAFTTEFADWINSKLLDVRSFDITALGLRDYAVVPLQSGSYGISRKFNADVSYDTDTSKWSLESFVVFEGANGVDTELQPGEELQDSALNDLRNAVQDLEIVGVLRKPDGLAADLKADKSLAENQESMRSLQQQGFFLQETARGVEMVATGGETIVGTEDGVQYLLRFGESSASLGSSDEEEEEGLGLRRYLLVTAQLDESKFPAPDLDVMPETVEDMLKMRGEGAEAEAATEADMPEKGDAETPAEKSSSEESDADDAAPAEEKKDEKGKSEPTEESANEESSAKPSKENGSSEEPGAAEEPNASEKPGKAEDPGKTEAESDGGQSEQSNQTSSGSESDTGSTEEDLNDCGPQEDDQPQEEQGSSAGDAGADDAGADDSDENTSAAPAKAEEASAQDSKQGDTEQEDASQPTREELEEELQAVRESINKSNQRKIDERNEKIDEARRKVQELNARFSSWYYVVSDSVYTKLKVTREQLIKPAGAGDAPAAPGFGGLPDAPLGGGLPPGLQLPQTPPRN